MRSLIVLLSLLLIVLAGSSQAQDLKPFQLYLTTGGQRALSDGEFELTGTLEPAYRITDRISAGLRFQAAWFNRNFVATVQEISSFETISETGTETELTFGTSFTFYGKYYFTNTSFRPYAGMGFGILRISVGRWKSL